MFNLFLKKILVSQIGNGVHGWGGRIAEMNGNIITPTYYCEEDVPDSVRYWCERACAPDGQGTHSGRFSDDLKRRKGPKACMYVTLSLREKKTLQTTVVL